MKRHAKQIVLWAAFLLLPMSVDAQITDYTGSLGATEYLDFIGGSGVASSYNTTHGRVHVGPYTGRFTTYGVTSPRFSLICVDFDNYAGDQWVNVTSLGTGQTDDGLAATRGAGAGSLATYRQAAYLGSLFESWEAYGPDRQTTWSGIHAAIWSLMGGGDVGGSEWASYRNDFLALASTNAATFDADGWYVLSAADGYNGQEMLIRTPASTVPEPSTYLLMATGLLFLVFFGRKRMGELEEG